MLSLDEWQAIGIVCGALVALAAVLRLAVKGVRRMFRLIKRMSEFFEQVNGDESENRPSMMDLLQETRTTSQDNSARLARIEDWQREHAEQGHGQAGLNGPVPLQRGRRR